MTLKDARDYTDLRSINGRIYIMAEENTTNNTENGSTSASAQQVNEPQPKQKEEKLFTQAQVDEMFNARFKRETEKWEQKLTESQKMAKMNAEQKAQYETEKKEQELSDRESEITKRELKMMAKEALIEKGLPVELADTLIYTDAENCTASIEAVEKSFKTAVEKAVENRLKNSSNTPKNGTASSTSGVEAAFYKLNPELKERK